MEKQLSECKKKGLLILLTAFAAATAIYMAVCDYAGISGKISFLQKEFLYIGHLLGFRKYPYWFLHGTFSGMLGILCVYMIYRMKSSKKRYGTLVLCLFIPYFVNSLFSPGSGGLRAMTLLMALVVGFLFAMANVPGIIGRAITNGLASKFSDLGIDAEASCQKILSQIEWIGFYPLKKALIGGLWLIILSLGLLGIVAYFGDPQGDFLLTGLFLLGIAAYTAGKAWRYIKMPYGCVPVLNKVLSKKQIQTLLQGERFDPFLFENADLQKYTPILVSDNWALIEGLLISRKLALRGDIERGIRGHKSSRIKITYLNGDQFQTRNTDIYLDGERSKEMLTALGQIAGISIPICASSKILEKYNGILPEISNSNEKLWYLLTHDIGETKKAYETMFAAPKTPSEKKPKSGRKK